MKAYVTWTALFLCALMPAAVWAQDEIVIEMHGEPSVLPDAPTLWDRDARQLTRKLRGKTREQVLYSVPFVSDKDRIIRAASGEYALVEYYSGGNFRKFLFKAESPQTFVAAAATAADVLAVNKKYGINIGLSRSEFEKFYAQQAQQQTDEALPENAALYKLSYTDVNTPQARDRWFLFERNGLTRTFETHEAKELYLQTLRAKRADRATAQPVPRPAQHRPVRKALISGGTEWDKANLPRVLNPKPLLPTPILNPTQNGNPNAAAPAASVSF